MLYRKIKKNNDSLSILGFGCMRLPESNGKINEKYAEEIINYAVDNGVNYLDTAMPYHVGQSEIFLGKLLSKGLKNKVKIATKLPHWHANSKEDMHRLLRAQIKSLQVDSIDYYLIHSLNGESWNRVKELGVIDFLEEAKKQGLIINSGFSFHGKKDDFKGIIDAYDWDISQIQYNFLDRQNQAGVEGLKYSNSKNISVIIMEPLRGGNLVNPVPKEVKEIWEENKIKRTPVEWGLRWIWNHPEVAVVLSGMNDLEHVKENIKIANEARENSLTSDELKLVDRVEKTYRKLMKVGCTGCRYCMPCPAKVNIPACFEVYNSYHMFGKKMSTKFLYLIMAGGAIDGNKGFASQCIECNKCIKKCPQSIQIPQELKKVKKDMENIFTKPMLWLVRLIMKNQKNKAVKNI